MTGAGAAAAGVAVIAAEPGNASAEPAGAAADAAPVVAHISDPASGTISLISGDGEVVITDHDLVGRITRAAKGI